MPWQVTAEPPLPPAVIIKHTSPLARSLACTPSATLRSISTHCRRRLKKAQRQAGLSGDRSV